MLAQVQMYQRTNQVGYIKESLSLCKNRLAVVALGCRQAGGEWL